MNMNKNVFFLFFRRKFIQCYLQNYKLKINK